LITSKALAKVEELVGDALAKGAKALAGAARHPLGGTFYEPTVLVDVPEDARLLREEIFGPVAISTTEAPSAALSNLVLAAKARITGSNNFWKSNMFASAGSNWFGSRAATLAVPRLLCKASSEREEIK
jgi:Aldehyde dehydrogenase family